MTSCTRGSAHVLSLLALACLAQGCWLLPVDPAPTLDVAESPELLSLAKGTIVVADGTKHLSVVSLPTGRVDEFVTLDDAVVASRLDESGRIVYVRESKWSMFFKGSYALVLKSLPTGEERAHDATSCAARGRPRSSRL